MSEAFLGVFCEVFAADFFAAGGLFWGNAEGDAGAFADFVPVASVRA